MPCDTNTAPLHSEPSLAKLNSRPCQMVRHGEVTAVECRAGRKPRAAAQPPDWQEQTSQTHFVSSSSSSPCRFFTSESRLVGDRHSASRRVAATEGRKGLHVIYQISIHCCSITAGPALGVSRGQQGSARGPACVRAGGREEGPGIKATTSSLWGDSPKRKGRLHEGGFL